MNVPMYQLEVLQDRGSLILVWELIAFHIREMADEGAGEVSALVVTKAILLSVCQEQPIGQVRLPISLTTASKVFDIVRRF